MDDLIDYAASARRTAARFPSRFPAVLAGLLLALAAFWGAGPALADPLAGEGPLTQADIDGYIYLTPRLVGAAAENPEQAVTLLRQAGLTRRRAVYVTSKVAVTQAVISGLVSPGQLNDARTPFYLRPSTEELDLVQRNLTSLVQAQELARRRAAGLPD